MRFIILIAAIFSCSCQTIAQKVIPLYYPDSIPNSIPHANEETRTTDEKGVLLVGKISRPTLTLFLPGHVNGNTPAVVICPGGGYGINAVNIEGYDEARVFNSWGVAAFVLTYRIPDSEALPIVFDLLKEEGLCMGGSTGINIAGAIRLAKDLGPGHTIVTILADFGTRYQSKLFNPEFLRSKGLPAPDWL